MENNMNLNKLVLEQVKNGALDEKVAFQLLKGLNEKKNEKSEDIAIIGMSARFPGSKDVDEYWENITLGKNLIGDFPENRKRDIEPHLLKVFPNYLEEGKQGFDYAKGGFVDEIDKFDAGFFSLTPREAYLMDPLQRLILETTWEAVEDAGYGGKRIYGTKTGVFFGRDHSSSTNYYKHFVNDPDPLRVTGSYSSVLSGRVLYLFNLLGPGIVVDTACSSALVAIHQACNAMRNGECEMALAGAIQLTLLPTKGELVNYVESNDGKLYSFDKNAEGTVWSEGMGVVLLKPLKKAIEDKDSIHAVIKASAINNDGASNGLTAPNAKAQEDVIIEAWGKGGIDPETISYIEAHGTGTKLGDPVEVKGLTEAFRHFTDKKQFCSIGTVKTNLGHSVAASGMAALIKVILCLKNKAIPASINFSEPNPYINFCDSPIYVNDRLRKWEDVSLPRRAGINAFGFSGTNSHLILEEFEQSNSEGQEEHTGMILPVSARCKSSLSDLVNKYYNFLDKFPHVNLKDMCYTASTGRGHHSMRLALYFESREQLKEELAYLIENGYENTGKEGIYFGEHRVVSDGRKLRTNEITDSAKAEVCAAGDRALALVLECRMDEAGLLNDLCKLYVKGAEFEWEELYRGQDRRRISIPVYSFEKVRIWPEVDEEEVGLYSKHYRIHPLVHRKISGTEDSEIYSTDFSVDEQWTLQDHKVMGNNMIPGTDYLEMSRVIGERYYGRGKVELRDVVFTAAAMVSQEEKKEVRVNIKHEKGYMDMEITSKVSQEESEENSWMTVATGKIFRSDSVCNTRYDLEDLKNRCKNKFFTLNYSDRSSFQLGPHWWVTKRVMVGKGEAFVEVELPENLRGDLSIYHLHPSLVDNAVNTGIHGGPEGTMYLPLCYGSMRIHSSVPHRFFSYTRMKYEDPTFETLTADILLLNEKGEVLTEIFDYKVKRVNNKESKAFLRKDNLFYEMVWIPADTASKRRNLPQGRILLLGGNSDEPLFSKLLSDLTVKGKEIIQVTYNEDGYSEIDEARYTIDWTYEAFNKLLGSLKGKNISQIIYALSLDEKAAAGSLDELKKMENRTVMSLFYLAKALVENGLNKNTELIVATILANRVTGKETAIIPLNAAISGLGKVIGQENAGMAVRCIDVDQFSYQNIIQELETEYSAYCIAYRNRTRYVEEFRRVNIDTLESTGLEIKDTGVYLITGGTGGIGLEIAGSLTGKGKVNIALVNRSRMPDAGEWENILKNGEDKKLCKRIQGILNLEKMGAEVTLCSASVNNEEEMKKVLESLRGKYGRINGAIHSAGIAGDGILARKEGKTFRNVLEPKIHGTWILDKLTREDNLDFFIDFSSVMSITGGIGQGDYTAANSYMDAFAVHRNKSGLRGLSINWPAWQETGMAADLGANIDTVFRAIGTQKAVAAFEEAFDKKISGIIIGELNFSNPVFKDVSVLPFKLSPEIIRSIERLKDNQTVSTAVQKRVKEKKVTVKGKEDGAYSEVEKALGTIFGRILGYSEIDIYDNFFKIGGDSLKAMSVVAKAKEMNLSLSDTDLFNYNSVAEIVEKVPGLSESKVKWPDDGGAKVENDTPQEQEQKNVDMMGVSHLNLNESRGQHSENSVWEAGARFEINTPEKKELKVVLQREINVTLTHSIPLCIILSEDALKPWLYEYYFQIYSGIGWDGSLSLGFFEDWNVYNDLIDIYPMGYELLKGKTDLVQFVIDGINSGFYSQVYMDGYAVPTLYGYQQNHVIRQVLIYGYDAASEEFLAIGFNGKNLFEKINLSFNQFMDGYESAKTFHAEINPWVEIKAIQLMKLRTFKGEYPFNIVRFINGLKQLNGSKTDDLQKFLLAGSAGGAEGVKYGFEAYDELLGVIRGILEGNYTVIYRSLHLLYEHKKLMCSRLSFIKEKYDLRELLDEEIAGYQEVFERINGLRVKILNMEFAYLAGNETFTEQEYIEAIHEVIDGITWMKGEEQRMVESICRKLKSKLL